MGKPRWASATCPETAPSWTSESTTEPEARTLSTPFFFSLFQTVLLPLNIFPGASLYMPFSLPELVAGHPLGVLPWTLWACPPRSAQHNTGQGHCIQLRGVCPDRGVYREAHVGAEPQLISTRQSMLPQE